tara:strand:- start:1665 stop:1892 length:228 start_codon:yes stop_codon:yes gene_type:complete
LHTGGFDFGEISTKSKPSSFAKFIASLIEMIPFFSPLESIKRTSFASICLLTLGPFVAEDLPLIFLDIELSPFLN